MKIRKAQTKDLKWIAASQKEMAWESEKMELNSSTLIKGVRHILKNPKIGQYWIVEDADGSNVGMCLCLFEWSDWRNRNILWVHSVWVETHFRQQGVFRKLYSHLQNEVLKNKKLGGIRLYVDKKNIRAQKVYQRLKMNNEHYDLYEWMKES